MTPISYTLSPDRILATSIDGRENVVTRVYWTITFTDGTFESMGAGVTNLDTSNLSNFIEAKDLTTEKVCTWVLDQEGGQEFINALLSHHRPIIERLQEESTMTELTLQDTET